MLVLQSTLNLTRVAVLAGGFTYIVQYMQRSTGTLGYCGAHRENLNSRRLRNLGSGTLSNFADTETKPLLLLPDIPDIGNAGSPG